MARGGTPGDRADRNRVTRDREARCLLPYVPTARSPSSRAIKSPPRDQPTEDSLEGPVLGSQHASWEVGQVNYGAFGAEPVFPRLENTSVNDKVQQRSDDEDDEPDRPRMQLVPVSMMDGCENSENKEVDRGHTRFLPLSEMP